MTRTPKNHILPVENLTKTGSVFIVKKKISKAVISRLPRYYRYLSDLMEENVDRISSNDLAKRMKVTASQIRQDLNNFGGFGQQGYGYNVGHLHAEIGKLLGIHTHINVVIIGAGHLGQALANYQNFEKRGLIVRALFDVDPEVIGKKIRNSEVYRHCRRRGLRRSCRGFWPAGFARSGISPISICLSATTFLWRTYIFPRV